MNIDRKVELAEQAIRNITSHHDAPEEEIRKACAHLVKFIDAELDGMAEKRQAYFVQLRADNQRKLKNQVGRAVSGG